MVNITKPLGSYHIIDDTKVSIRYRGQSRTCAKCHKAALGCPGLGMAKDCTAQRVMLSDAMKSHWKEIGFEPDQSVGYDVLEEEDDIVVQIGKINKKVDRTLGELNGNYCGIKVVGTDHDENLVELHSLLVEYGLPDEKKVQDLLQFGRTVYVKDVESEACKIIVQNIHQDYPWDNRKISVKLVTKPLPSDSEGSSEDEESDTEVDTGVDNISSLNKIDAVQDTPVNLSKRNVSQLTPNSSEKKQERKKRKQKDKANIKENQTISSMGSVSSRRGRSSNKSNP